MRLGRPYGAHAATLGVRVSFSLVFVGRGTTRKGFRVFVFHGGPSSGLLAQKTSRSCAETTVPS